MGKYSKLKMHSSQTAEKRIAELLKGRNDFMKLSRMLAEKAQRRERLTVQPKESLSGKKAVITISNYLGGYYYLTADEAKIKGDDVFLVEGKHSKNNSLPSLEDIKDGLLKMILFTNLENVEVDSKEYNPIVVLKLTVGGGFKSDQINDSQKATLELLSKEAEINKFRIVKN